MSCHPHASTPWFRHPSGLPLLFCHHTIQTLSLSWTIKDALMTVKMHFSLLNSSLNNLTFVRKMYPHCCMYSCKMCKEEPKMPSGSVKHSVASNTSLRAPSIFIQCFSFFRLMLLRLFGGYFAGLKLFQMDLWLVTLKKWLFQRNIKGKERKGKWNW